jgi:hypothetical protein
MRKAALVAEGMRSLAHRTALLWLPCTLSLTGCSWLFMSKVPEPVVVPNYPIDCTASKAAPILDTICSGYFVANGIFLAAVNCTNTSDPSSCNTEKAVGIVTSAVLAGVCGFSAGSGFGYAAHCQESKDLNALCITGDFRACQALKPGWTPGPPPQYAPSPPYAPPPPPPVPFYPPAPGLPPPGASPPSAPSPSPAPAQQPPSAPGPDAPRAQAQSVGPSPTLAPFR